MRFLAKIACPALIALGLAGAAHASAADFEWETFLNPNRHIDLTSYGGKLWMASETGGVTVLDLADSSFTAIHRRPGGLVSNSLVRVLSDGNGRVWFGSSMSGVSVLDVETGSWELLTGFEGLPSDTVTALAGWGDSVWVGTPSGFAVFEGLNLVGRCNVLLPPDIRCPLENHTILAIAPVEEGAYLGTPSGVVWFDGRSATPLGGAGTPGFVLDLAIVDEDLWAMTFTGASRWDPGSSQWVQEGLGGLGGLRGLDAIGDDLYAVTSSGIYVRSAGGWSVVGNALNNARALVRSGSGDLWAAGTSGLYLLVGSTWEAKKAPGPLFDDVRSVAVGEGGEMWFTGAARVTAFDGLEWTDLTAASTGDRLQRCDVYGLLVDSSGRLWFGHCCRPNEPDSCLVDRLARSVGSWRWRRFGAANIWRVAEGGGSVWLGARFTGLYRIGDGESEPENIQTGTGLSSLRLSSLTYEQGRGLWIGHIQLGVDLFKGGEAADPGNWSHIGESDGLLSDAVRKILVKGAEVWVGTQSGISVIDPSTMTVVRNYTVGPGGIEDRITDVSGLALDGFGDVWASTDGNGVYLLRQDGTILSFNTGNSPLCDDGAKDIAYDPFAGAVWVSTFRGIAKISRAGAPVEGAAQALYVYPNPYCPAGCDDSGEGALRLGGVAGESDGEIVDIKGQLVARFFSAGPGDVIWNGVDFSGDPAGAGLYFVIARSGAKTYRARFALLR